MKKYNLKKTNIVSNLLCLVICVIAMLPFMWMIATSLRLPVDSFRLFYYILINITGFSASGTSYDKL